MLTLKIHIIEILLGIFIVAAKRTPFGAYGGKFVKTSALELQEVAAKAALTSANIKPEVVDSVVIGNVLAVRSISIVISSNYRIVNDMGLGIVIYLCTRCILVL